MTSNRNRIAHPLLWALVALILFRLITLALYPLMDTTEARYGEIGRKMAELGDWITPWIEYDKPFWGKPPMSFWLTAASIKLFGANEFAARLPHFMGGLFILWLVWDWLKRRSAREALIAITLLAGSALFFVSAGAVMTDMTLAIGTTLAMRGFWLGLHGAEAEHKREPWLFFLGLAIGLLAKGPLVFILVGVPLGLWTIFTKSYVKVWRRLPWLRGLLLTLLLALPWYLLAEQKTPGFLNYFIVGEHWHRFVTAGWKGDLYGSAHAFPRGSIWIYALGACLPWALLLPVAAIFWRKSITPETSPAHKPLHLYLWLWGLTPCLFFTFAGNILWTYVLPALPALAILGADWLARHVAAKRVDRVLITGLLLMMVVFAGLILDIRLNPAGDVKTTKALVQEYKAQLSGNESLLFLGSRPQSASFYSEGKAELVTDVNALALKLTQGSAFVAIGSNTALASFPADLQEKLKPVATHGAYRLYSAAIQK